MSAKSFTKRYTSRFIQTYRVNGDPPDVTDYPADAQVSYDSTRSDGGSVPDWKGRIRRGESATTNVTGTHISVVARQPAKGWFTRLQKDGYGQWKGPFTVSYWGFTWPTRVVSAPSVMTIQSQKAEAIATQKFYSKIKAINQDMQGLVFLGELRETLRMLRNPAAAFFKAAERDYIQKLRRYKKADPRNWTNAISGSWLEFQFGVQPLVSDMKGAYDALDRLNWDPVVRKNIHAVGRDVEPGAAPTLHQWSTNAKLSFTGETHDILRKKVVFKALWMRERDKAVGLSTGKRLSESLGFTLSEFVPTLWELMPWSFLIDYFANIGDILEQTFTSTSEVRWVVGTTIHDHETFIVSRFDEALTRGYNTTTKIRYLGCDPNSRNAEISTRRRTFTRASVKPPTPHFMWKLPGNRFKQANMAALLAQADLLYPQQSSKRFIWRGR